MFLYSVDHMDVADLFTFLLKEEPPVVETTLLREFFPENADSLRNGSMLELYYKHFTLYHALYSLEMSLMDTSYFLYIKNIWIYLRVRPDPGFCSYFDEAAGDFCRNLCESGRQLCTFHNEIERTLRRNGTMDVEHIRYFYLDPANRNRIDEKMLTSMIDTVHGYAQSFKEIDECLQLFGIDLDYSVERLKERYRYLTKKYHPDVNDDSEATFKKITSGYNLLRQLKR